MNYFMVLIGFAQAAVFAAAPETRVSGGLYTPERLANLRANTQRYDWARKDREDTVKQAAPWLAKSNEALWRMVPGQNLPRCIDVTMTNGAANKVSGVCPNCGTGIKPYGNYPWIADPERRPWKIQCPNCKAIFPTNDFGKYYESGLDEHGVFDPKLADRKLLFNAEHPDPADPKHLWGVDDGFGFNDPASGLQFRFIGYYTWRYWRHIRNGISRLSTAFVYTGDQRYAAKAAVLYDRLADVYPAMDWHPYAMRGWFHSDGGTRAGKIEGAIWETALFNDLATDYDGILTGLDDQPELYAFLKQRAEKYRLAPKGTRELLVKNVDDGLLRAGVQAIRDRRIKGNVGMHQAAMAAAAIALNSEPESSAWLDWIFAPGGGALPGCIVGRVDRDGFGDEGSPTYSLGWIADISDAANRIAAYPAYTRWNVNRDFPQFRRGYTAAWNLVMLDMASPNIGDTGRTGNIARLIRPEADAIAEAYRYSGDERLARAAFWANNYKSAGLGRQIADADPDTLAQKIQAVVDKGGKDSASPLGPKMLAGYGLAKLEYGSGKDGTGAFMYFGRNRGHGHADRLNIGLFGFGFDLSPDLGYPELAATWPHRNEWSIATIAHNTVVIDRQPQRPDWDGRPVFFKALPGFQAVEVSSPNVYASAKEYRRTLALVQAGGGAYAVDIFRVAGGSEHLMSVHGPGVDVTTNGLKLSAQTNGTYAGESVPFGPAPNKAIPQGFSWLTRIERAASPSGRWQLDWRVAAGYNGATGHENIHLRLWNFTGGLDEVALADGQPPQNKPGNPKWLRYALLRRKGENLSSTFVSILEPYRTTPLIKAARRIEISKADPQAGPVVLEIELIDGARDLICYSPDGKPFQFEGKQFTGRLGFIRRRGDKTESAALIGGTMLRDGKYELEAPAAQYTGAITAISAPQAAASYVDVDARLPADGTLAGEWMTIQNDGAQNACYQIESISPEGSGSRIRLGDACFIRSYADPNDYAQGFRLNFDPGAPFAIVGDASDPRPQPR